LTTVVLIAVWGTDGDAGNLLEAKLLSTGTETKLKLLFVIDFSPVFVLALLLQCLQMEQWRCMDGTAKALGGANKLSPHPQSSGAEVSPAP